jgi:hypothetical protein
LFLDEDFKKYIFNITISNVVVTISLSITSLAEVISVWAEVCDLFTTGFNENLPVIMNYLGGCWVNSCESASNPD